MTPHVSDEALLALLHGELEGDDRARAREHIITCPTCSHRLMQEARLDSVLQVAHPRFPVPPLQVNSAAHHVLSRSAPSFARRAPVTLQRVAAVAALLTLLYAINASPTASELENVWLTWHTWLFLIPLIGGALLVLGSLFGVGAHHEPHVDVEHDVEHDADDHESLSVLSLLGIGRVPLSIVMMMASLIFGVSGVLIHTGLSARLGATTALWVAIAGAVSSTVGLTGVLARLIHRLMPTTETFRISRHDLAGCRGTMLLKADGAVPGYAQVKDHEGNVHNLRCRALSASLPKGTAILVVSYDEQAQTYVVEVHSESVA